MRCEGDEGCYLVDESDDGGGDLLAKVIVDDLFEDRDPSILKSRGTVIVDIESILAEGKGSRANQGQRREREMHTK
jgi:hypothetical protein